MTADRAPDFDVVVSGAGGAGCAAALAAAFGGCTVLLADAKETFRRGCNTALSTSMIPAGGSRWQAALEIADSPDRFYADVMKKTRGAADATIARALVDAAPRLVDWLNDACGVPLELPTDFLYPGHSVPRCHTVADRAGATLHRHLVAAVERQGGRITLAAPLRLRAVHVDAAGAVAGCTLERPDGTTEAVGTSAVVLASNGFGANRALVRRYIPEIAGALYFGGDGSVGDALLVGEALGADTGYLDAYQGHGSVATPHGILCTWIAMTHGGIILNTNGERFGDESTGYSEFAGEVVAQPGGIGWVVLDRRIDGLLRPFADYGQLLAHDAVRWEEDAAGVTRRIGAPVGTVEATLEQVRRVALGQAGDSFGRTHWEAPLEPPYGLVKVEGALFHTQGGLLVDRHARALRGGVPIPGLYAAGGAAAGMSGHGAAGYLAGNGLLAALGLGFVAGSHLAATTPAPEHEPVP